MKKVLSIMLICTLTLCLLSACSTNHGEAKLSNANADDTTKQIYEYIKSVYGTNILTGQQESTWMDDGNVDYEM